jgi:hypothetical protein
MYDESVEATKRWLTLRGQEETARALENSYVSSGIESAYMVLARHWASFAQKQYISPVLIALPYVYANEKDIAIQWLEKGYDHRAPLMLSLLHSDWDPLRSDPRFQDLLRRMNFPE